MTNPDPTTTLSSRLFDRRRLLGAGVLGAGGLALADVFTSSSADAAPSTDLAANIALAHAFYAATNNGRPNEYDHILSADWINHPNGPGRKGYKQGSAYLRAIFPDIHITVDDAIAQGDKVAVHNTVRGTMKGAFLGVAPTGKRVSFQTFAFHRIAGGVIVESWHVDSFYELLQQVKPST